MYRHILIPTDGSELAEHGVTNGLSLAKSVGAKVTAIIVEEPFDWLSVSETKAQRAFDELAKHTEQIKKHAASVLNRVANAAKQAGVPCDTIQVEDARPYQAIIATARDRGCDLRHGIAWAQRTIRSCARQCDKQGADAHEDPGTGLSLNAWAPRLSVTFLTDPAGTFGPYRVISGHGRLSEYVRFTPKSSAA